MKTSKESGEFQIVQVATPNQEPQLIVKLGRTKPPRLPPSEDEIELAKREGATRARIDREHQRLMRLVADASVGYLKHGNARGASSLWRDMTARLADFRERHAKLGLILVCLSFFAACSNASGQSVSDPDQDADPSPIAAQQAATSHCRCYVPDPAQFPGDSEAACVTNETDALKSEPYTCTPSQFSACLNANQASCNVAAVAGGACGVCFGSAR
jgi:hypothetical protein